MVLEVHFVELLPHTHSLFMHLLESPVHFPPVPPQTLALFKQMLESPSHDTPLHKHWQTPDEENGESPLLHVIPSQGS